MKIYRILIALCGIVGISMQIYQDGFGMLLYYTVISNLIVVSFLLYIIKCGDIQQNNKILRFKGAVTMIIAITFIVYHFLLAPKAKPIDYWNVRNFLVHYIAPIGFILDTIIFDPKKQYRLTDPLFWTTVPVLYCILAIVNGLVIKLNVPNSPDSPFPYFFININKFGIEKVILNIVSIAIGYIIVGYVLYVLKRFIGKVNK